MPPITPAGPASATPSELSATVPARRLPLTDSWSLALEAVAIPAARSAADILRAEFSASGRQLRHVAVAQYHERLLPQILQLAAGGTLVEVFGSPKELVCGYQGKVRFVSETIAEWLAQIDSLFNEAAYLEGNADVAQAVANRSFASGWEHFFLFGQFEGRTAGSAYFSGLAEFDGIAFDATDTLVVARSLAGRLQPHHRLIVGGASTCVAVPSPATQVGTEMFFLHSPPAAWLGPRVPLRDGRTLGNWPRVRPRDIYPVQPPAGGEWPTISVVTVSFNQAAYLSETIRSVLGQNYPKLEYIIVDGGSTDGSVEIIRQHSEKLAWWTSERDGGQSEALNKGFRRATGEILTWLNSDDRLAPGSLFAVAETFRRHAPDLVTGRCARIMDHDLTPHLFHRSYLPVNETVPLATERLLDLEGSWQKGDFFHQPEVFFTREIFDRAGGSVREDLYYSMDYDLWVRMAKVGATIRSIPEITAIFRQHKNQKTGGADLPFLPELRAVNAAHRGDARSTT